MGEKLPSIQWYPGDWRKDPGVQALDYESRGIYLELLFMAFPAKRLLDDDQALACRLGIPVSRWVATRQRLLERQLLRAETNELRFIPLYVRLGHRQTIQPSVRRLVLSVGRCAHCGSTSKLTVDHIIAVVHGGTDAPWNLQALCWSCNRKKGPQSWSRNRNVR